MNIDISSLRLPDSAFWEADSRDHGLDPVVKKFRTSYFGIVVDGPGEVILSNRSTLPLFAYYMGKYGEVATRDFPRAALVVAMDPDRNEIRVVPFVRKRGETLFTGKKVPASDLPDGYLMTFQALDVRSRTELPWVPGRVISQILLLDLASNRIETRLLGGAGSFVDEEKEKFLAAERAKLNPPAPYPRLAPSTYAASPDSPPVPESFGIVLSAPRVAVIDGKQPLVLRGSWRLPVFPEELVKAENAEYNETHGLIQRDGVTPFAACVTIHLLILGTNDDEQLYHLRLPVAQLAEGSDGPTATGQFNIDLTQAPEFPLSDQTIFIYAYAKDWAANAAPIGIVYRLAHTQS